MDRRPAEVTILGGHFTPNCTVTFGDRTATGVEFVSDTTLRAMSPPHPAGAADVAVVCGTDRAVLPAAFTFDEVATRRRAVRH
jgi:hypothetical protein